MKQIIKTNKENLEITTTLTNKEFRNYHFYRGVFATGFSIGINFLFLSFFIFSFSFKFVSLICFVTSIISLILSSPKNNSKVKGGLRK